MKTRFYLYGLLIISVLAQAILVSRIERFPDVILLMVVFTGIFLGGADGASFGFIAGFFRGCLSVDTLALDILIFPAVGALSSLLPRMFYRQNPAAQVITTATAAFMVIAAHTFYLNMTSGNDIGIPFVILMSRRSLIMTVLVSPFAFAFLKWLLRLKP